MTRLLALTALLLAATAATAGASGTASGSCTGKQLSGTFSVIKGSAGAGNISYRLALKNVSAGECLLSGLPQGRLRGRTGKLLPTNVKAAFPGGLTAILVRLAPGQKAYATARFSPDVPGPGEPTAGRNCEPVAWWFRVAAQGGGTVQAKLVPPTAVCEHGRLLFSAYTTKP